MMIEKKMLTVTRQYQLHALGAILLFASHLLLLFFTPARWLQNLNLIISIALLAALVILSSIKKRESPDELSELNRLKADSFALSTLTVGLMLLMFLSVPIKICIPINMNFMLALFWFLTSVRSAAFLYYER